jgi:ribose transport system substrate-binding protein
MAEEFKYWVVERYSDMVEQVYYVSDQFDVTKQMNNFDDLVTKGCDIIFLSPLDANTMVEKIKQAEAAGIKVILGGTNLSGEDFTAQVNVSDYQHGFEFGKWMGEQGVKGKVAVMNGIAGTTTAVDVHNGIVDGVKNYPDIQLLPDIYTNWDYAVTKQATQDVLQANPDLAGIISHSDPRSCAEVFLESGKPLIPITWMGSNGCLRVWKENLSNGMVAQAFTKPPRLMEVALDIGMKALKGEEIQKFTEVPVAIITEAEIDDYYRADLSDRVWWPTNLPDEVLMKLFPKE